MRGRRALCSLSLEAAADTAKQPEHAMVGMRCPYHHNQWAVDMVSMCVPLMPGLERDSPTWISGAAMDICMGRPPCCPSARLASSAEGVLRWAAPQAAAGAASEGVARSAYRSRTSAHRRRCYCVRR